eukprot:scaffold28320_cov53-Phaeocystis_antarctica.AAC.2
MSGPARCSRQGTAGAAMMAALEVSTAASAGERSLSPGATESPGLLVAEAMEAAAMAAAATAEAEREMAAMVMAMAAEATAVVVTAVARVVAATG